jgi:hypothetical protein
MENKPKSLHVNPVGENWEVAELAKELASTAKDDRGQPRDAAFPRALLNPESDRHPTDFSSLVIPLGCRRHSARCPLPGDLQNILRSY